MLNCVSETIKCLDAPDVTGNDIVDIIADSPNVSTTVNTIAGNDGTTDTVAIDIDGGTGPTLGIIGRLGGLSARPKKTGLVSDADGAIVAIAVARYMARQTARGDSFPGDTRIRTHICPNAPTQPGDPAPMMGNPVSTAQLNDHEVDTEMDAVLSVDATKANNVVNHRGFALSPTVKEGSILEVSEDLLEIQEQVTGERPVTFPLSMKDITPYGSELSHINSILQPGSATDAPVVGVGLTARTPISGSASDASYPDVLEAAARFCVATARRFGNERVAFYDAAEYRRLRNLYGTRDEYTDRGVIQ